MDKRNYRKSSRESRDKFRTTEGDEHVEKIIAGPKR
jgi:hypothetical protein